MTNFGILKHEERSRKGMRGKKKDCEEMTEGQLLRELARRFIRYDKARDRYVDFLHKELDKAGVDYEDMQRWEKLHMDQDEKFCCMREAVRVALKDPTLLWC